MSSIYPTLLLTGAAGVLGRQLRPSLAQACQTLRLSDRGSCGPTAAHEQDRPCQLADRAAMEALLQGVDAVVHLGGVSVESPFEQIAPANIEGVFHLYEAARLAGTRRIVFASSNHVTGCYPQGEAIGPDSAPRPDGYYGVAKLFGENLARLYWDRHGIETVCLRIGTATAEPPDRRALSTWLGFEDLRRLVLAALAAPGVGFLSVYGVSANPQRWWSDAGWERIGYAPQQSAEAWRKQIQDLAPPADSPEARLQGGSFLGLGPWTRQP
ncbi:NAD-dependent epimerase/dehydratase family protein [Roseateles violae]|uniref:NAD(P)-dependent oxidoreductase n=1 Tax=Roseateles violae TaxID=3058042 RepID=A0ABT8DW84_9BURK|nr:NAD(P)-dependent oxidoreductase [Pelomonas sp. PFR6]MDN3921300.1 NAD(P)-dependent oxidoreductase [Pelomonas sp. PFR6]